MASLVSTTTVDYFSEDIKNGCFYAEGRHWLFYTDGTNGQFRSSTDGVTWSDPTQWKAGVHDGRQFSLWFDGTYVHYVYSHTSSSAISYRRGDPASDGTISWSQAEQSITITSASDPLPSVCVDSDGYACVSFKDSSNYPAVIYNANNDGTWTTAESYPVVLSTAAADTTWNTGCTILEGRPYVIYARNAAVIGGKLHTSGSTWGSEEAISGTNSCHYGFGIDFGVDGSNYIYVAYHTLNNYREHVASRNPATGTWTQSSELGAGSWPDCPVISVLSDGTIYLYLANFPDTGYVNVKKRIGGEWDADWSHWSTNSDINEYGSMTTYQCGENRIGVYYLAGTGSPFSVYFEQDPSGTNNVYINYGVFL